MVEGGADKNFSEVSSFAKVFILWACYIPREEMEALDYCG